MVNYGEFNICLDDDVNEAFVAFSYEQDDDFLSAEELVNMLIEYGLIALGYLEPTNSCVKPRFCK